jgi:hypothetical protein
VVVKDRIVQEIRGRKVWRTPAFEQCVGKNSRWRSEGTSSKSNNASQLTPASLNTNFWRLCKGNDDIDGGGELAVNGRRLTVQ